MLAHLLDGIVAHGDRLHVLGNERQIALIEVFGLNAANQMDENLALGLAKRRRRLQSRRLVWRNEAKL
jgi:hypothetical protein